MSHLYAQWAREEDVREVDGAFVVEVGTGQRAVPADRHVAAVAWCLFRRGSPLTPEAVYRYVVDGSHDQDAGPAASMHTEADPRVRWLRGDVADTRFATATLAHVACNVVQSCKGYEEREAEGPLGYGVQTLTFPTREAAKLASAVHAHHTRVYPEDVLRYLSCAMDTPVMVRDLLSRHADPPLPEVDVETTVHAVDTQAVVRRTHWRCLVEEVRRDDVSPWEMGVTSLPLLVSDRRCIGRARIVHAHWRYLDGTTLVHRQLTQCDVRAHATMDGVVVELVFPSLHLPGTQWPWWLSRDATFMDASYLSCLRTCLGAHPRKRAATHDLEAVCGEDDKSGKVVDAWKLSLAKPEVTRIMPTLLRPLPLHDDEVRTVDGTLVCRRMRSVEEMRANGSFQLIADRWGKNYPLHVHERMVDAPHAGLFAVMTKDDESRAVGVFAVVLYELAFPTPPVGVLLLIDTFAVDVKYEENKLGTRMYYECCLSMGFAHASRMVVVAQCVVKGRGRWFWWNKLDDSSLARCLLLQVLALDRPRLPVQSERDCTPRAREYVKECTS